MKTIRHIATLIALAISTTSAQMEGPPDLKTIRDSFSNDNNVMTLRLKFHIVQTDRFTPGSPQHIGNPEAAIDLLVGELNSIYQFAGISFLKSPTDFIQPGDGELLAIDSSDEKRRLMDEAISRDEATRFLNIVVVPIRNLGFDGHATFPWSRRALRQGSGVLLSDEFVFPFDNGDLEPQIAAHEIGHALGLWHVERGVNDHETDGLLAAAALKEIPALTSLTGADATGDFCRDTPPIPYKDWLGLRYTIDLDPTLNDGKTFKETYISTPAYPWPARDIGNLMRSSGDRRFISPQQKGRMRGWITHRLGSWLVRDGTSAVEAVIGDPTFPGNDFKPGIRLEWQAPVDSVFQIHRSESPDFSDSTNPESTNTVSPVPILTPQQPITGPTFPHSGGTWQRFTTTDDRLQNGKSYWYRIRIGSNAATASYSPRMDVRGAGARTNKARPALIPVASGVRSVPGGILIDWRDSADDEISGFELRRSPPFPPGEDVLVKPGTSRFASFFDRSPAVANANYTYQIYSYYLDETTAVRNHSGNIGDGPEQGKPVVYSTTPPPDQPVLSYTKATTPQGWRGTITASFRGKVPAPTTTGGVIRAILEAQTDAAPTWHVAAISGILTTGASSPALFSIGELPTGANYHFRLDLSETLKDEGGTIIGTVRHGLSQPITIRIPGRIYTAPVPGQPAAGETGTFPYPSFTWSSVQDATGYLLYLRRPGFPDIIKTVGNQTSYAFTGVDLELDALTEYTWFVRATNDETEFGGPDSVHRTFTTQLHKPNLVSPAEGDIILVPSDSYTINPTFQWHGIPGGIKYRLIVKTAGPNGVEKISVAVTDPSFTATPAMGLALDAGQYTWQVIAFPTSGGFQQEPRSISDPITFRVSSKPLRAPALYNPGPQEIGAAQRPNFQWEDLNQATNYVIEIIQDPNINNRRVFGGNTPENLLGFGVLMTGTAVAGQDGRLEYRLPPEINALPGARKFYWRMRGRNEIGGGPWSSLVQETPTTIAELQGNWAEFTTRLDAPTLIGPANGATISDTSPNLTWQSAAGADSNLVEVYEGTAVTGTPKAQQIVSGDSWNMPEATNELADGVYLWRVRSYGPMTANQVISGWSQASFTLGTPPREPPVIRNPMDGDKARSITPNFQWEPRPKASSYRIEVRGLNATNLFFEINGVTGTGDPLTYTLPANRALAYGTDYEWRIAGQNTFGTGKYSLWTQFRTEVTAPTLIGPVGTINDQTPELTWNSVAGANSYMIEVYRNGQTNLAFSGTTGGSIRITTTELGAGASFQWRVRAVNSGGSDGPWSAWGSFSIRTAPNNWPQNPSPTANSFSVSTLTNFSWSALNQATHYDLEVVQNSSGVKKTYSNIAATTFTLPVADRLSGDRIHYWKVRGRNELGPGPWSNDAKNSDPDYSKWIQFRTTLDKPVYTSPTFGSQGQSRNPTLQWQPVSGAGSYEIQVWIQDDTEPSGRRERPERGGTSTGTSFQIGGNQLSAGTLYYWRVRAVGPTTNSGFGANDFWYFITHN